MKKGQVFVQGMFLAKRSCRIIRNSNQSNVMAPAYFGGHCLPFLMGNVRYADETTSRRGGTTSASPNQVLTIGCNFLSIGTTCSVRTGSCQP